MEKKDRLRDYLNALEGLYSILKLGEKPIKLITTTSRDIMSKEFRELLESDKKLTSQEVMKEVRRAQELEIKEN